jgi:hypothetical protein
VAAWALGVAAYLWIAGSLEPLGLAGVPALGASLPSLAIAAAAHLALSGWIGRLERQPIGR